MYTAIMDLKAGAVNEVGHIMSLNDRRKQLGISIRYVEKDYATLSLATRESLKQKQITPKNVASFLLYFTGKQAVVDVEKKSLLINYYDELKNASSIDEIFSIISLFCCFIDYELLESIIEIFGDENDKKTLEEYIRTLKQFLISKPDNTCVVNDSYRHILSDVGVRLRLKLIQDCVPYRDFKCSIARIFNVQLHDFCLESFGNGSIELVFVFSRAALQLPLSFDQKTKIAKLTTTVESISKLVEDEEEILYSLKVTFIVHMFIILYLTC